MTRKKILRIVAFPVALAALAAPFTGCQALQNNPITGTVCCTDFKPGTNMLNVDWGLKTSAENLSFGATMQAIGDFSAETQGMVTDLGVACKGLALDLGVMETAVDPTKAVDAASFTTQWCAQAGTALGQIKGSVALNVQPAKCDVSVNAEADCEGQCSAQANCTYTPAEIVAGCSGGVVAGQCSAMCSGSCEGSANLAVSCNGDCSGTCEGQCNGTASSGACSGTCSGKCRGTCKIAGGAMATCEGTCAGGCSVDFQAPKCRGTFTPPMVKCMASGDCQASCNASASAKAECTPPSVDLAVTSNIGDKEAALRKWLPIIYLNIQGRLTNLQGDVQGITKVAANFQADLSGGAKAVFCIVPAVDAMNTAGVNVQATATAAASISGNVNQM